MQGKRGLLLILILSLLAGCQSKTQMSAEQQYLQTLQKSQAELTALFENGQPQSPDWLAQLSAIGEQWSEPEETYHGSDEEVAGLAQAYETMGKQVCVIAEALQHQDTEKAIDELEKLKSEAGKNGEKLNEIVQRWN